MRVRMLVGVSLLLVAPVGCSISRSVSDSVSSPFEWSASSSRSSSQGRSVEYEADVRDYTEAYVRSGGEFDKFTSGLSRLASKHGISNWEEDPATYTGIGRGLKKAKVTQTQLEVYETNLSKGDPQKARNIVKGYDEEP